MESTPATPGEGELHRGRGAAGRDGGAGHRGVGAAQDMDAGVVVVVMGGLERHEAADGEALRVEIGGDLAQARRGAEAACLRLGEDLVDADVVVAVLRGLQGDELGGGEGARLDADEERARLSLARAGAAREARARAEIRMRFMGLVLLVGFMSVLSGAASGLPVPPSMGGMWRSAAIDEPAMMDVISARFRTSRACESPWRRKAP